jgi:hypothetical protein
MCQLHGFISDRVRDLHRGRRGGQSAVSRHSTREEEATGRDPGTISRLRMRSRDFYAMPVLLFLTNFRVVRDRVAGVRSGDPADGREAAAR